MAARKPTAHSTSPDAPLGIASMTGFARIQGQDEGARWTWEVRSVNGRGLDLRCRVPAGFDEVEAQARERTGRRIARGSVNIALQVERTEKGVDYRINTAVLDRIAERLPDLAHQFPSALAPSLDGLLALRGVIEPVEDETLEDEREARFEAILQSFDAALEALITARAEEGGRLAVLVGDCLNDIERLGTLAREAALGQPQSVRAKLEERIAQLGDPATVPAERLAQEVMLAAAKADVREELDRLQSHVEAARALLAEGGSVGRKFDFLCQEFNREANTLCSKAADLALTRLGLDLKVTIDQMREQIQNIA